MTQSYENPSFCNCSCDSTGALALLLTSARRCRIFFAFADSCAGFTGAVPAEVAEKDAAAAEEAALADGRRAEPIEDGSRFASSWLSSELSGAGAACDADAASATFNPPGAYTTDFLRGTRGGMALHSDVKTAVVLSTASSTGPKASPAHDQHRCGRGRSNTTVPVYTHHRT
jgi:hypothetical protein